MSKQYWINLKYFSKYIYILIFDVKINGSDHLTKDINLKSVKKALEIR